MHAEDIDTGAEAALDRAVVERRLDDLERESQARRAELRALAAELPEATSSRAFVRSMVASVVDAPDRPRIAKRVALKIAAHPVRPVPRRRTC